MLLRVLHWFLKTVNIEWPYDPVLGFRMSHLKCASMVCDYFELKSIENGLTRNFYLSLKEFKWGSLPIISIITRNHFSCPIDRAGQTRNSCTLALLAILPWASFPLQPEWLYGTFSSGGYITPHLTCLLLNLSCVGVPLCTYLIKLGYFVSLSHVYLITRIKEEWTNLNG